MTTPNPNDAPAADAQPAAGSAPAAGETPAAGSVVDANTPAGELKPDAAAGELKPDAAAAGVQPAAAAAPASYTLTLPEGGPLDQADVDQVTAIAKAHGWTNDQAQAALVEHAENLTQQSARFRTAAEAHAEIGGAKLEAAQVNATAALDKFLPANTPEGQELRAGLAKTGYANWTPLVLLLSRIGAAMREDGPITADASRAGGEKDMATLLYGGKPEGSR